MIKFVKRAIRTKEEAQSFVVQTKLQISFHNYSNKKIANDNHWKNSILLSDGSYGLMAYSDNILVVTESYPSCIDSDIIGINEISIYMRGPIDEDCTELICSVSDFKMTPKSDRYRAKQTKILFVKIISLFQKLDYYKDFEVVGMNDDETKRVAKVAKMLSGICGDGWYIRKHG